MKIYTGIGSRKTPPNVCQKMTHLAGFLATKNYLLRSGGADGADLAFEAGIKNDHKEIYLPWKNFNNSNSTLYTPSTDAFTLASQLHPYWSRLKEGPRKLHARNCHQILGLDLQTPTGFVICWTENGEVVGGTATALKLAMRCEIPIYNLAIEKDREKLTEFLKGLAA